MVNHGCALARDVRELLELRLGSVAAQQRRVHLPSLSFALVPLPINHSKQRIDCTLPHSSSVVIVPANTNLLSNSATYLISNIVRAAIPFALLPVLTRYLSPTEYGQVAMFEIVVAALAAFTGVSVQGAANRKYYDVDVTRHDLAHYIGACMQILGFTTVITFILAYVFRKVLAAWLGLDPAWILWAVPVSAAAFIIAMRLGQWQIRSISRNYAALQVSQGAANMLIAVLLVVVFLRGAAGRIDAQIVVTLTFAAVSALLLVRDKLIAFSWRADYMRDALLFGVPLIPHVAGIFLLGAADRLVINGKLGLSDAGIYMVALQLTMAMSIVFDAINKAYVPWLFERLARNDPHDKRKIVRWTYLYFAAALAAAALAFLIGPYAVTLLAGSKFHEAGRVVGWLALGQAFGGMYLMVTNYVFYSKRTGLLSLTTITAGLINVGLLLILVKPFGLLGAAWAFAAAMAIRFIVTWLVAHKRHPMPWLDAQKI